MSFKQQSIVNESGHPCDRLNNKPQKKAAFFQASLSEETTTYSLHQNLGMFTTISLHRRHTLVNSMGASFGESRK
jgi:hypothetical protein